MSADELRSAAMRIRRHLIDDGYLVPSDTTYQLTAKGSDALPLLLTVCAMTDREYLHALQDVAAQVERALAQREHDQRKG